MSHRAARRRLAPLVVPVVLSLAVVAPSLPRPGMAQAAPATTEKYLGRWNYDQPDRRTGRNVAVFHGTGFQLRIPQIGDIVFSPDVGGLIVGRTDQGCVWRFRPAARSLELDPPSQTCHNPVSHLSYTIDTWSVTVSGRHERETLRATSHHQDGDFLFVLDNGSRTKVREYDPHTVPQFLGSWEYDPADAGSRVNIRATRYAESNVVESPEQGRVTFARDRDNRIIGRTRDGCAWMLAVRGNTAKLDPPSQTCDLSGSTVTLTFWTIAGDGRRQSSALTGIDTRGGTFTLAIGSLTKAA